MRLLRKSNDQKAQAQVTTKYFGELVVSRETQTREEGKESKRAFSTTTNRHPQPSISEMGKREEDGKAIDHTSREKDLESTEDLKYR